MVEQTANGCLHLCRHRAALLDNQPLHIRMVRESACLVQRFGCTDIDFVDAQRKPGCHIGQPAEFLVGFAKHGACRRVVFANPAATRLRATFGEYGHDSLAIGKSVGYPGEQRIPRIVRPESKRGVVWAVAVGHDKGAEAKILENYAAQRAQCIHESRGAPPNINSLFEEFGFQNLPTSIAGEQHVSANSPGGAEFWRIFQAVGILLRCFIGYHGRPKNIRAMPVGHPVFKKHLAPPKQFDFFLRRLRSLQNLIFRKVLPCVLHEGDNMQICISRRRCINPSVHVICDCVAGKNSIVEIHERVGFNITVRNRDIEIFAQHFRQHFHHHFLTVTALLNFEQLNILPKVDRIPSGQLSIRYHFAQKGFGPCSTMRPCSMTMTSSAMALTVAKSCVMNIYAKFSSRCRRSKSLRMPSATSWSRAEVTSSQMMKAGGRRPT